MLLPIGQKPFYGISCNKIIFAVVSVNKWVCFGNKKTVCLPFPIKFKKYLHTPKKLANEYNLVLK